MYVNLGNFVYFYGLGTDDAFVHSPRNSYMWPTHISYHTYI